MLPFLFLHIFVLKLEKCCSNYQGDAEYFGLLQLKLPEAYFRLTIENILGSGITPETPYGDHASLGKTQQS